MIKCKIFKETNHGSNDLEREVEEFFDDGEDIEIISMNTVIESIEGIDYMNIIVLYKIITNT